MEQNLSLYKIFYTVAQNGSISKAATTLFISQPAISKSIQKLEKNLNVSLFSRTSRGVQLTKEGHLLLESVKIAFQSLETAEKQLKKSAALEIGNLIIGVSTTLCKYTLLPYLKDFIRLYPHIQITIQCQSSNKTRQLLEENKIDIGLIGKPETTTKLVFQPITEIHDVFVATRSYLSNLLSRNKNSNNHILQQGILMLLDKENITRVYINDFLEKQNIQSKHLLEVNSMDLLIDFAKISLGIACVIKEFVQAELDSETLIQIPMNEEIPKRVIGFAYPNNNKNSQAMQAFLNFLNNHK
jgi:Transcriptional regulator